jgi:hypothetical protein
MSLVKRVSVVGTLHVDVANDEFDDILDAVGGWAESSNHFSTTVDGLEDLVDDDIPFVDEMLAILERYEYKDIEEVVVSKENPK